MKRCALALALCCPGWAEAQGPDDWRRVASDADRARLRDWRVAWVAALAGVPGLAARDPALFNPDRALADAMLPAGHYRCRVWRLAETAATAGAWNGCRVEEEGGRVRLVMEDGVQRAAGYLFPDTAARAVFLGTVMIGDEARALRYGRDRQRDMAGTLERVAPARWRLAMPDTRFGARLNLMELVPG